MLGLLIVDHGSKRGEANAQLEDMARRVARLRPDDPVELAHLEQAEPTIAQALARLAARGAKQVVVLPYFLSEGRHSKEDIPRACAEAAKAHEGLEVRVAPALGPHDELARLLLERGGLGAG